MTEKEKAQELVAKYLTDVDVKGLSTSMHTDTAKQCALIAVDEILKIRSLSNGWADSCKHLPLDSSMTPYWQQVKTELQNL